MGTRALPSRLLSAGLCLGLMGLAGLGRWGQLQYPSSEELRGKEVLLVPPGRILRHLDLGYHTLAADLLFIRANLYYGQHILGDESLPWLDTFVEEVIALDPDFAKIYLWGAVTSVYRRRVNTDTLPEWVQRANQILERGMRRFPQDSRFPMRIAFNLHYELGQADAAIPYFERAARLPGAPPWLRQKLADLYTREGNRELARRMVQELAMETEELQLGPALQQRLAVLLDEDTRAAVARGRERWLQGWRGSYEHIPLDLYLLLREEDSP
ncbi:MAG TPA: hypothetical protein PK668_19335 [Myxococcota bacterium]|nr:hypothetical protein [Myxococcota bacterium]HRY95115.1 hypothetical protein [Myxococcota bacterium]HSA21141.1 hypothetical protein [Myxococcota bacterium]